MNFSRQNFGDGAHNIFQVNTTSSNTLAFGSTGMIATTPTVFGDTSHKIASNTSGFGPFNQQNTTMNTASNAFVFGAHPTFAKLETKTGSLVFGSASTETNLFVQNDHQSSGSLFPSTDPKGNLTVFGQNASNAFTGQNVAQASTSQTVFGSLQTQPTLSFGSNHGTVLGSFGSANAICSTGGTFATGGLPAPVFGNPVPVSSSTNVFGVQKNPQQSLAFFASSTKKPQPPNVFGNSQTKGVPIHTGKSEEMTSRVASPRRNILARGSEGSTRIEVQNIPDHVNNKSCLQKHFSKFGKVVRILSRSNGSALVAFETQEAAKNAKENGHFIDGRSEPMIINLKSGTLQRDPVPIGRSRLGTVPNPESATQEGRDKLDFRGINNKNFDRSNMRDIVQTSDDYVAAGDDGTATVDVLRQKHAERSGSPQFLSKYSGESTLKGLASTRASNSDDRFRILEQRDKIIRNATQRNSDLATSEVVKGTCPDMCPEKERYMRECRRRLSVFEMVPGTDLPGQNPLVDHSRAVKEYSRSSADQEMPLPSELRPPQVLNKTMDYLLACIMDKGHVGFWAEWYDFLWNRMRGIRKDITQQMLCDTTSVELVEKSARFHILCSELLCEEEPGVFDQKINSENLTKCLQTLKELYHDLYVKHGIRCRNEAEFRSYMLLMNINNAGDILREAQQWRSDVRLSTAFKSSLHVYSSVTSNNYIKFFKLVKRAGYLDSCILHRYFNQVRSVAVTRTAKAFNSPAAAYSISYPFQDLINHLGFESSEEAATFLGNFGLVVTNGLITSDKKQGKVTELEGVTLPIRRSSKLVGSKVKTSLGEIVNGGPLQKVGNHVPQQSFNEQGYFLLDEVDAPVVNNQAAPGPDLIRPPRLSLETRNLAAVPSRQSTNEQVIKRYRPTLSDINEAVSSVLQGIVNEVTGSLTREVSEGTIEDSHRFMLLADLSGEAMLREAVEECVRECSIETIVQVNKEKEELVMQANQTAAQIYEEVVQFEMQNLCTDTFNSAWLADAQLRKDNAIFSLVDEILNEVSTDESEAYCLQYYQSRVKHVLDRLEDIRAKDEKILMRKVLKNWIAVTKQKQRDRKFPSTVNLQQNSAEVFRAMFPRSERTDVRHAMSHDFLPLDGSFGVSLLMMDEIISKQEEIKLNLEREEANIMERRKFCWSPLGILRLAENNFVSTMSQHPGDSKVFWKLIVSLPAEGRVLTYERDFFTKWLSRKFKMAVDDDIPDNGADLTLLQSKPLVMPSVQGPAPSCYTSLNICIRSITEGLTNSDLLGASSILFFIRDHSDFCSDHQILEMELQRLRTLLRSKLSYPPLPLAVMGSSKNRNWTESFIAERLGLQDHLEKGLINDFIVELHEDLCVNRIETTNILEGGIEWLMQRSPKSPPLHTQTILEFFEGNIHRFFTKPVLNNLKRRKEKSHGDLPLSTLVDFYNRVVGWLMQIVTASELRSVSWPPSEFCGKYEDLPTQVWNTKEKLIQLESFIRQSILLPDFPSTQDSTFVGTSRALSEYIKLVTAESNSPLKLVTKINNLLEKKKMAVSRKNMKKNERTLEASYFTPPPSVLPRTSIVLACIDFKLSELFGIKDSYDNRSLLVTYFTNALQDEKVPSLDSSSFPGIDESSMEINVSKNHNFKAMDSLVLHKSPDFVRNGVHNFSNLDAESPLSIDLSLLFDQINSEKEASHNFGKFLDEVLLDADDSIFENGIKFKKAKLMSEEEMESPPAPVDRRNNSPLFPEDLFHALNMPNKLEDDMNYLNFKIAQEKKASVLLDLKTKLYLDDLLG